MKLAEQLKRLEELIIRRALLTNFGNVSAAARQLGLSRSTIFRKLKRYDAEPRGDSLEAARARVFR